MPNGREASTFSEDAASTAKENKKRIQHLQLPNIASQKVLAALLFERVPIPPTISGRTDKQKQKGNTSRCVPNPPKTKIQRFENHSRLSLPCRAATLCFTGLSLPARLKSKQMLDMV
jgi:hypothetical protein